MMADNSVTGGFAAVVIGTSAGGLQALSSILPALPADFPVPVMIVQHRSAKDDASLTELLGDKCSVIVKQAEDKETPAPGHVYIAPAGYHLLVEADRTLSLSVDPPVNSARPAIDVLFETAAESFGQALIAVVLTGASSDGAAGLRKITSLGGQAIVQDPATAYIATMPQAAIEATAVDCILPIDEIGAHLITLVQSRGAPK